MAAADGGGEDFFESLSAQSGFPADQIRYLVCLIALVPLSVPFRLLPSPALKHLFSIVVGVAMCHFTLGPWSWAHSLVTSAVCYLVMVVLPHGIAHKAVFVLMLGHLSASHIYRMITDWMGWSLDFTGPQMILVIKMTTLAFNYFDGNEPTAVQEKMRQYQKDHRIKQLPNLLEFYGYVYFFPSFLAGPSYEIRDYLAFVDGSLFKGAKDVQSSFPILQVLKTQFKALLMLPCVLLSVVVFPLSFITTPAFAALPLWERLLRVWLHVAVARWKYFLAWYLAEAGFVACGAAYNGKDKEGNPKWDRVTNCNPLRVEFPENVRQAVENWNIVTQSWLKNYVYLRLAKLGFGMQFCTVATYSISAFWHGFYPGYYITFVFFAVMTETAKTLRRKVRPLFMQEDGETPKLPAKYFYDLTGVLVSTWMLNYSGASFLLLALGPSWELYNNLYFLGHIGTVILSAALIGLRTPKNQPPRGKAEAS